MLIAALQITATCLAVAAILVGIRQLVLWLARYDDTLNNTTDEHSEWLGIGGGDIFQHRQPASETRERNND